MRYCPIFKQKIKELKEKAEALDDLLLKYKETGDENIAEKLEIELEKILNEVEEIKKEFKENAVGLIKEFIQRTDNERRIKIIFDEKKLRFIIEGDLDFRYSGHLNDFPNLVKEITCSLIAPSVQNVTTLNLPYLEEVGGWLDASKIHVLNLPNLKKVGRDFIVSNIRILNLPNVEEINGSIYFQADNSNLGSLIKQAKEWRKKGILKGKIMIVNQERRIIREI
jgi:hypothetical protein